MSDINVPGIGAGKYDKLIETLMKKERAPRDAAVEDLKKYEQQNTIWRHINQFSTEVRDSTRALYSFNNPFVEKIVQSSNERAITATASRDAKEQTFRISIAGIAQPDSFLSKEMPKEYQVPKGVYTFTVGEKNVSVQWQGGKYRNFINAVNRKGKDIIRVSEIKTGTSGQSLLFESQMSGAAHRLTFSDDALTFALDNEIIKKNDHSAIGISKTSATVQAQSNETIHFAQPVKAVQSLTLKYSVSLQNLYSDNKPAGLEEEMPLGDPVYERPGSISYQGVTIINAHSDAGIIAESPSKTASPPSPPVQDNNVLSLISSQGTLIPLPAVDTVQGEQTFQLSLSEYGDIKGIAIHNKNSEKTVTIDNIKISDPKATGEYIPVNPVSQAQDAEFTFEGVPVKREKNKVDDLIAGVTLHLEDKTDKKETISVKPDVETAKNAIIAFVAKYNRLLAEINIVTTNQEAVIDEISYFTEEERKTAQENLGSLFGDTTLTSFKNRLRQIVTDVYRKNDNTAIRSLAQIGISTQSDASSGYNESRLRGYLEIDEKKLDDALKTSIDDVRALFGYDTDNDILVDDGVAFQFFKQIDPYIQRGGIFSTRTNGLTAQIKKNKERIARYDKELEKKEQALKQKYGVMDGSLRKLQKQSEMIENFKQQNKKSTKE